MKPSRLLSQYAWIVRKLYQRPMTLEELQEAWRDEEIGDGNELSRTTFTRHRNAIEDMLGLEIECDRKRDYKYAIAHEYTPDDFSIVKYMLSTVSLGDVLQKNLSLRERILLEEVNEGLEFMPDIFRAMRQKRKIRMTYCKFGGDEYETTVEPYALRIFRRRWYMLGKNAKYFSTYSFDRIRQVEVTREAFEMDRDFSAKAYFADFFGVYTDNNIAKQRVIVRAYSHARHYLDTLPLHPSQQIIATGDDYVDFAYDIRPTNDFLGELLRHEAGVEILEPAALREEMMQKVAAIYEKYHKK